MRKFVAALVACAVFGAIAIPAALATNNTDGSNSAVTGEPKNLFEKGGRGIAEVTWSCEQTVSAKNELSIGCDFKNASKTRTARFVMCMMLDLKASERKKKAEDVPGLDPKSMQNWVLKPTTVKEKGEDVTILKCEKSDTPAEGYASAYHFGCQLFTIKPGETVKGTWKGKAPYLPPKGRKVHANDFVVRYADTINLTLREMVKFDEASCADVVGQGQYLVPLQEGLVRSVTADWIVSETPFTDPVLGYQGTALSPPEDLSYALFENWPCAPPTLPEERPPEPRCPAPPPTRPPTSVDLNLYWFTSVPAPGDWSWPVVLQTSTAGYTTGVRLQTDPPPGGRFLILGGREALGSIRACSATQTTVCVSPNVPEGADTSFRVSVLDARTRRPLFTESGDFVQDTQPPYVDQASVQAGQGGLFTAAVHAVDATTSPIAANLWYSTDAGASWQVVGLSPTSSLLDASRSRGFTGRFSAPAGATVRYYVVVEDGVGNGDWYGPETLGGASPPPPPPATTASGSLNDGTGSVLDYSIETNTSADAFELTLPTGVDISGASYPSGFTAADCSDSANVETCTNGTVQANTALTGSFSHTGTITANCACAQVAFSNNDGTTWLPSPPATLTGPPASSPPPSPTYSCVGSQMPLLDNFNVDAVLNGGTKPSFSTNGTPYCLISISTYHWNNGNGDTPGTIGLLSETGTVGPWQATGSAGSPTATYPEGVPNADWTVTPSSPSQPVIINGTYACDDSNPATWSQNTSSSGQGFCEVWVQTAQQTG